jgi:hypothetical protein
MEKNNINLLVLLLGSFVYETFFPFSIFLRSIWNYEREVCLGGKDYRNSFNFLTFGLATW